MAVEFIPPHPGNHFHPQRTAIGEKMWHDAVGDDRKRQEATGDAMSRQENLKITTAYFEFQIPLGFITFRLKFLWFVYQSILKMHQEALSMVKTIENVVLSMKMWICRSKIAESDVPYASFEIDLLKMMCCTQVLKSEYWKWCTVCKFLCSDAESVVLWLTFEVRMLKVLYCMQKQGGGQLNASNAYRV